MRFPERFPGRFRNLLHRLAFPDFRSVRNGTVPHARAAENRLCSGAKSLLKRAPLASTRESALAILFRYRKLRIVPRDDRPGFDLRAEVLAYERCKFIERLVQYVDACRIDALDDEDRVFGIVGERRALTVTPIPAAADRARVIAIA